MQWDGTGRRPPRAGPPVPADFSQGAAVRHRRWGPGTVTDVDVVTVRFAEVGYKTVSLELATGETLVPLD